MIRRFLLSLGNFVAAEEGANNDGGMWMMLALVGVLVVVLFVVGPMMRRKKQAQYVDNLHKSMQVGATVKTLGGLIGKIVSINESDNNTKEVVLETGVGPTKSTMTFDMMYIYAVVTNPDGSKYMPPNSKPMANKQTRSTVSVKLEDDDSNNTDIVDSAKVVEAVAQEPEVDTTAQSLIDNVEDNNQNE